MNPAHNLPYLAQRVFNTPLALHPSKAEMVMAAVGERFGVTKVFSSIRPMAMEDDDFNGGGESEAWTLPVTEQGIALIPVQGMLVGKLGCLHPWCGMTGYDGIRANFVQAFNDPDVKAIILDIDSPGGEVGGCFDLADMIFAARGKKPIWAVLNENAFSSAYALASAADRICVPRTGGTGSIGVIALIADMSQALKDSGVTVNIIQFGARKADGYPEIPLAPEARKRFQADVNAIGQLFVNTVARNRRVKSSAVAAQQAVTFMGQAGVRAGLADYVCAPDAAYRALVREL